MKRMEYVPLYTRILEDPEWRQKPPVARLVFYELLALSGANGTPGVVYGSDRAIAAVLRVRTTDFQRSVDVLAPSVQRGSDVLRITNWDRYSRVVDDKEIREEKIRGKKKKSSMSSLREDVAWWGRLEQQYPDVALLEQWELARDWDSDHPGRVKSHKLFFHKWVKKAPRVTREMSADERRAQLRGVS